MNLNDYKVVNCFGTPLEKYPFAEEIEFCLKHIRAGDTVIDVGANAAYYSLPFSDAVGRGGRVESFEPSEKYREFFAANMRLCAVENAGNWSLHPLAVGRDCNAARLVHSGQSGSTTGLYTEGGAENSPDPKVNIKLAQALIRSVWIYGTGGAAKALFKSLPKNSVIGFIDTYAASITMPGELPIVNICHFQKTNSCILVTGVFRWQMQAELDKRCITNYLHIATPGEVVTVPQTTIDDFCLFHPISRASFIKIDTDGGEADVLEGAVRVLDAWQPKIFCEVNILHDAAQRIFNILYENNYEIWTWPDERLVLTADGLDELTKKRWDNNPNADGMNIFAEVR